MKGELRVKDKPAFVGTVILPRKPSVVTLFSGHKKYYNYDKTFNSLQTRMVVTGIQDEIY